VLGDNGHFRTTGAAASTGSRWSSMLDFRRVLNRGKNPRSPAPPHPRGSDFADAVSMNVHQARLETSHSSRRRRGDVSRSINFRHSVRQEAARTLSRTWMRLTLARNFRGRHADGRTGSAERATLGLEPTDAERGSGRGTRALLQFSWPLRATDITCARGALRSAPISGYDPTRSLRSIRQWPIHVR
jgi:hypothetical protein